MDDHSACAQPNGFQSFYFNGLLPKGAESVTRPIDPKRWARAEERTAELISRIQPNWTSEKHRNAVASYVQRLIGNCVPCQVFTFGSVPLRTYLPDGDIDLTTFSEDHNVKDNWANCVLDMLRREEKNVHAEFQVQEVQYIQAEVKVIKCLVGNIVVDISFNQLGGLCTLCFLEEVDNLINQNHLFKRSIILIKAWCYYESRILGAHHGLISTYALETLVLYIFNVFNNSFAGPLEVLFRFMEFFSKFDWANFCVSLRGPVPICSLPSMEADPPRQDGAELLLNKMFLNACSKAYSVFRENEDHQEHPFISKHFNVVDPLRINNNLGRSVSKGNFYRIRSAFSFGAQKLARILECQEENIVAEVNQFFVNTWYRHGKGCRPDAPILDLFHTGHADSEHERNCRKKTSSENPTVNSTSQFPQNCDSHNSMDSMMQPHSFPVNQIAGWDQNFFQRMNPTKKQQSERERISRAHLLQIRRHATPQFARTSSSPELTRMSGETVSLRRHNESPGRVKEVATSSSECLNITREFGMDNHILDCFTNNLYSNESSSHLSHCIPESSQSFGCHTTRPVSSSTKPDDEGSHNKQQEQDLMNLHMPVNLASHPFVSISTSISECRTQIYSGSPPLAPYQQYNHVESTPEVEIMGGLHGEAVSLKADHLNDDHSFWTDSNAEPLKKFEHETEEFSIVSPRISPLSPVNSYGTKESSESSWEGKSSKMRNAMKISMTKSGSSTKKESAVFDSRLRGGESVCHIYDGVDERSSAPSMSSSHGEFHQLPGFGQSHVRYPNSMLPVAPLLVRPGPQQGVRHNNAVLPVAFYPAGPVPIVTMVPVYDASPETGASGAPVNHDDIEMEKPTVSQSSHSPDSIKEVKQLTHNDSLGSTKKTTPREQPNESEPDIFNSDFISHWTNLQYGRICQTSQLQYPFVNPPSVMVPPSQLQGNIPFDAPRSPYPRSSNVFVPFVPVARQQPSPSKSAGVSRQYSGESPKHRNGTGTYFPNPEVIRDRQFVTSRQYQVDPKHGRNDYHGGREANWNFSSKPRVSGRGHPRYRHDKRNSKIDRSVASSSQTDKPTFQKNSYQLYHFKDPSTPKSTWNEHYDGDYMVYQSRSDFRDEVSQTVDAHSPLLMLYPYPQNFAYGSCIESLHFGSAGPEPLIGTDKIQVCRGFSEGCDLEQQSCQGDAEPISPEYVSPRRFLR